MLTSSHILVGAVVASRPVMRWWQILLAWAGGFAPDASIFAMVVYSRLFNGPGVDLWSNYDGLYWQEPWQTYSAISSSFPLWSLVMVAGFALLRYSERFKSLGLAVLIFTAGYFLHITADFFTHADDAYAQFWPFSDWRFYSPVSYWQPQYYGRIFGIVEMIAGIGIVAYLIYRFRQWPVRVAAALMVIPYFVSLALHF
ncbi:MAG TPA: hypothetical protein ENJ90_01055 [Devosia sp.]|nr:hypothetical protein [Devosia sp.]